MIDPMIWVDIETTGLDPVNDALLEVGFMLTNSDGTVLGTYSSLVDAGLDPRSRAIDFVQNMHDASGLWNDLAATVPPAVDEVEIELIGVLDGWAETFDITLADQPLCGSSVHFDRSFLVAKMPAVDALFKYRNIDISTLKELVARRAPLLLDGRPTPVASHRAVPDLHDTVAEATYYFNTFLIGA